jgi:hypothetical protein
VARQIQDGNRNDIIDVRKSWPAGLAHSCSGRWAMDVNQWFFIGLIYKLALCVFLLIIRSRVRSSISSSKPQQMISLARKQEGQSMSLQPTTDYPFEIAQN